MRIFLRLARGAVDQAGEKRMRNVSYKTDQRGPQFH